MKQSSIYHPLGFFLTSLVLASIVLLTASYASYQPSLHHWLFLLILASLSSPTIAALLMFYTAKNQLLWTVFCTRLSPKRMQLHFFPFLILLMPCMVLIAITISLACGGSSDQFSLAQLAPDQALEGKNMVAIFLISLLGCSLEEIGWRGYGIESLMSRYNLFKSSWIFATFWSLWHVPAFFIKNGYFQQEVWNLGPFYTAIYFMTLFPVTFLINWAYIKNNRTIISAILMHTTMNLSVSLFQIQPFTKVIFLLLLSFVATVIVLMDKELWLSYQDPTPKARST